MKLRHLVFGVLLIANIITAIGVVHARHDHRQLYIELTRLERARDELNIDFGRLQLEQATVAMSNRVDQVAREKLGMRFPETAEIVVVRP
ncbi:cell division protein FtsL [Luteimonas cellulosilyticus]|jgi:cell division protein FtsL|uniref:cell division protein FtsL n=1 Tax=Luteimonas cellulosilyticus TaxID=2683586 RepID=UPI003CCDFA5B